MCRCITAKQQFSQCFLLIRWDRMRYIRVNKADNYLVGAMACGILIKNTTIPFQTRKWFWKYQPQNVSHFAAVSICWVWLLGMSRQYHQSGPAQISELKAMSLLVLCAFYSVLCGHRRPIPSHIYTLEYDLAKQWAVQLRTFLIGKATMI